MDSISGVINVNKPENVQSNAIVQKFKRILNCKKIGHAGTLDPLATGVLLLCVDEATKISQYLMEQEKQYSITMLLGVKTDSFDVTGKIIEKKEIPSLEKSQILNVFNSFLGESMQVPPMFSALKYKGQPLYKYAKKGIEITRAPRKINITKIKVVNINLPRIDAEINCSKGTYVRSLTDDIGKALGTVACVERIQRQSVGNFNIKDAFNFDQLMNFDKSDIIKNKLIGLNDCLNNFFKIEIKEHQARLIRVYGKLPKYLEKLESAYKHKYFKLVTEDGNVVAIGNISPDYGLKITRMFNYNN
jgi:tRNA pseudouridine55 synthase